MSLRKDTPCDHGECPYGAEYMTSSEYWCGADEPVDDPEIWEEEDDYLQLVEWEGYDE